MGRISECRGGEVWGGGVPLPTGGRGLGRGCAPSPEKKLAFFASKSHVCDAL